jgi:hypothetical protein
MVEKKAGVVTPKVSLVLNLVAVLVHHDGIIIATVDKLCVRGVLRAPQCQGEICSRLLVLRGRARRIRGFFEITLQNDPTGENTHPKSEITSNINVHRTKWKLKFLNDNPGCRLMRHETFWGYSVCPRKRYFLLRVFSVYSLDRIAGSLHAKGKTDHSSMIIRKDKAGRGFLACGSDKVQGDVRTEHLSMA